jgi:capsular exopolysaccharide synthesis family protein
MELRTYLTILWRRKWIIAFTVAITLIVVVIGTLMMTPKYVASATIRVVPPPPVSGQRLGWNDIQYADRLMNTYTKIATSGPVLTELADRLGLDRLLRIEAEIPANTELMQITVEDSNPIIAMEAANTLAEILIAESNRSRIGSAYTISLVEPAVVPQSPSKPRKELNIALGLVVGLVGGLGLAFLFENLDTTLYTTEDIETVTELAIIGQIPMTKREQQITFLNGHSAQGESFRRLRTNIFIPDHEVSLQTLLVTSAEPGEGKSTIVANLAYAVAQAGRQVLVIDCDLRLPTLHKIFNLSNEIGLSNVLKQEATLTEAIQASQIPGVQVLTSGPSPAYPAELLGSPHMSALLEQLKQQFDLILLDSPASLAVTDAAVLAPLVDGVLLVVGRAQSRQRAVEAAQQQLTSVKARLVGIVVNRAELFSSYHYYYRKEA